MRAAVLTGLKGKYQSKKHERLLHVTKCLSCSRKRMAVGSYVHTQLR